MPTDPRTIPAQRLGATALVAACAILIPTAASVAGDLPPRETMQERQACMPDVLRLCRALVPNRQAITDCLVSNRERLSPACHDVVSRHQ